MAVELFFYVLLFDGEDVTAGGLFAVFFHDWAWAWDSSGWFWLVSGGLLTVFPQLVDLLLITVGELFLVEDPLQVAELEVDGLLDFVGVFG